MDEAEQSDEAIVAMSVANNERSAEQRERRALAEGKSEGTHIHQAQDWDRVYQSIDRLRQFVTSKEKLTTLPHHVNVDSLRAAFFALRHDAAPGVDGVTWTAYAERLESHLAVCHEWH